MIRARKEDVKYFAERSKIRHQCKCGHTVYIPEFVDKVVCSWCSRNVYRTEQIEFKDRLKSILLKGA